MSIEMGTISGFGAGACGVSVAVVSCGAFLRASASEQKPGEAMLEGALGKSWPWTMAFWTVWMNCFESVS
jgi:hypothetical protein